jgi:hypothetical protein
MSSKKVVINESLVSITSSFCRAFPQHARMTMDRGSSYLTIGQSYVVPCLVHRRTSVEEKKHPDRQHQATEYAQLTTRSAMI